MFLALKLKLVAHRLVFLAKVTMSPTHRGKQRAQRRVLISQQVTFIAVINDLKGQSHETNTMKLLFKWKDLMFIAVPGGIISFFMSFFMSKCLKFGPQRYVIRQSLSSSSVTTAVIPMKRLFRQDTCCMRGLSGLSPVPRPHPHLFQLS